MTALLTVLLAALPPVGPVPAWVSPVDTPALRADGAAPLLLHDLQVRAGKTVEVFERRVWQVRTVSGLSDVAQHEFEWDPASERLTLHGLWVWRDGQRRQAWHPEDARVLRRESQLDEGIYDGRLTLRVELRDLRVGDLVEVASTTSGENAVYQGHFSFRVSQAGREPIALFAFRLLWARPRPLAFKAVAGATPPTIEGRAGETIYSWSLKDPKSPDFIAQAPADLEQLPLVEFSDWGSWAEVDAWAQQLFVAPPPDARVKAAIARFARLPRAEQARDIIRSVQDDVRYVGIELGAHSHLPHSPTWVLERGFGDCKDKTLLLVTLLNAVGVEAFPALVHTSRGQLLPERLPAATQFNHAIVRVSFPDGPRFIDATRTLQRGDPARWENPRYAQALVIRPGASALEPIAAPSSETPTWEVHQRWSVPAASGPATLEVETVASGVEAAQLRGYVSRRTHDELQEERRADREEILHGTFTALGLEWEDDEGAERFTVREKYEVAGFFDAERSHDFELLDLQKDLVEPPDGPRTVALARAHPVRVRETITYEAPEPLPSLEYDLVNRAINHPAFALAIKQHIEGNRLSMEWNFHTRGDRVSPAELESYRAAVKDARSTMGYWIRRGEARSAKPKGADEFSWFFCGGVMAVVIAIGVLISRPEPTVEKPSLRARFKQWRFRARQKGSPGELPSSPLKLERAADALKYFKSRVCPVGHAWPAEVVVLDRVRLGDERLAIVGRKCATCGASEHRYARLRLEP